MLTIIVIIISILLSFIRPHLLSRFIFILSLALPTSHGTTHSFSLLIANFHFLYTDILLLILVLPWLLRKIIKPIKTGYSIIYKFKRLLLIFLGWGLICVLIGLLKSFDLNQIFYDLRPIFYYIIIFVAMDSYKSEQRLVYLSTDLVLGLILYCTITLSIVFLKTSHPLYSIFEEVFVGFQGRIVFANDLYFLFALPLLVFIFKEFHIKFFYKVLIILILMLFIIKVFVSMSRMLIVLAFISLVIPIIWDKTKVIKSKIYKNNVISKIVLVISLTLISLLTLNFGIAILFGENSSEFVSSIYGRFTNYNDSQWQATHITPRATMFFTGISEVFKSPLFGHGYGYMFDINSQEWSGMKISFIDSSLITLWIREGLIGILILMALILRYYQLFSCAIRNAEINRNLFIRALNNSIYGGGICFIFISIFNSILVNSTAILPFLILCGATLGFWDEKLSLSKNN